MFFLCERRKFLVQVSDKTVRCGFLCASLRQSVRSTSIMSTMQIKAEVLPKGEENIWYTKDYEWPLGCWTTELVIPKQVSG